nr:hypothetical protein [Tanacetum cinerariifolium]
MHDGLRRATTTASSLEAEQDSGNISKTQTKATPSGPISLRISSEGGLGCHVTIGGSPVQAKHERLSNLPNEPPLREALENELKSTKAIYNKALITLTKKVKLEKKLKHKRRRTFVESSVDEEATTHKLESDDTEVVDFSSTSPQKDDDEITLAETLVNIKKSATKDKDKAIMQEFEPSKKIKKKEMIQISLNEEITQRFYKEEQAQLLRDEEYAQQVQAQWDPNPNFFDCPPDSCHPPHTTYETYSYNSYGNDFHFGYDCQPQFPLNYESEPGYIENYTSYLYDSSSFPQQYPYCEDCGVTHKAYHCQPPQYTVNHPVFNAHDNFLDSQKELNIAQNKIMEQMTSLTSMCEMACQIIQKKQEEKRIEEEQAAKAQNWKILACCDDDDD